MEKSGLYSRPSIMLQKQTRTVNKNYSLADKEAETQAAKEKAKLQKMQEIHEHRRIQMYGSQAEKRQLAAKLNSEC